MKYSGVSLVSLVQEKKKLHIVCDELEDASRLSRHWSFCLISAISKSQLISYLSLFFSLPARYWKGPFSGRQNMALTVGIYCRDILICNELLGRHQNNLSLNPGLARGSVALVPVWLIRGADPLHPDLLGSGRRHNCHVMSGPLPFHWHVVNVAVAMALLCLAGGEDVWAKSATRKNSPQGTKDSTLLSDLWIELSTKYCSMK